MAAAQIQCSWAVNVGSFVSTKLRSDRNGNNYKTWKGQMLCLVQSQGLLGFIDGNSPPPENDEAWRRTDWLLKGWILGALSEEVLHSVVSLDSARDVWLELENKFSQPQPPPPPPPPPRPRPLVAVANYQENGGHKYLPLYRAATSGDWDTAEQILELDPDAIRARLACTLETALHVAVGNGNSTSFVSKLVEKMSDEELAITDELGYNPLHVAALTGNLHATQILLDRLPHLLYVPSSDNEFPVHLAAYGGHRQTLDLLVSHTKHNMPTNPFQGVRGLQFLMYLIDAEFFDMALKLVHKCPHLAWIRPMSDYTALSRMALIKNSAISGDAKLKWWERLVYPCIKVEMEMQSLDIENQACCSVLEPPRLYQVVTTSLCKVLIQLVPCMKRVHQKKLRCHQALTLVKCLCEHLESLKHEKALAIYGDAMLTAAKYGAQEVIEIIVGTFPHAIYSYDATTKQSFLHLAVRDRCEQVFNLMYQTSNHRYHYSNKVDSSGNSILHLAARLAPSHKLNLVSGAALQMQREMQWFEEVAKFVSPFNRRKMNNDGKTPEMIFTEEHKELKIEGEKWMKDTANSCTIAAALIVTVVFAAGITVPGGNESSTGYPIFSKSSAFTIFAVSDAVSLFTSTTSLLMFLSILTSRYAEQDFVYALPKRLCIGLFTLFLSILFMMAAFASTVYLVFGRKNAWILIPVAALTCLPISSFVLLQFPLLIDVCSSTYGRGIFDNKSDRPFHYHQSQL